LRDVIHGVEDAGKYVIYGVEDAARVGLA